MRDILLTLIIFGSLPFIFVRPYIGLLVYSWISFMSPHRLTWGFAYNIPFAMIVGALFIFSWLVSKEPKKPPLNAVCVLTIVFTLWMTVTTIFALHGEYGNTYHWDWWVRVTKIMLITVVAMIILTNRQRIDGFIWIMVLSIGLYAFRGGIFTVLGGGEYRVYGPTGSMIQENNALGIATIMMVPLVHYLYLQATNKMLRRALLVAVPVFLLSAMGSHSRGALLAVIAMGGFMLFKSRHKLLASLITVIIVVAGLTFLPQKWYDRMATIQNYEQDRSAMSRINTWTAGINLVLDRPIVGGGFRVFNNLPIIFEKYAPDPSMRSSTHNNYIQVLANHGFPGLFIYLSILVLAFRSGGWLRKRTRTRPDLQWAHDLGGMCQVSIVGFSVGGMFLNLAYFDLFWGVVSVVVATRVYVGGQLVKNPESDELDDAALNVETGAATPAGLPRQTYLRKPAG